KLYPDAELPELPSERLTADLLILNYRSIRGMADLAEGLLEGAIAHYGMPVELTRKDLPALEGGIQCVRFQLQALMTIPSLH
ncbi:heme NO-binding domain-containing protein, partial [Bacillus cereus group sp. BC251]|uniref:heme NO-binding domain-containing protein n=1 Tax=Bacillus cereus group sp. BC251 TaxID=3445329 RepID=UPI003F23FF3D